MTDKDTGTSPASLLSRQLDEYRLDELLGRGGMARVYRGFDTRLKRPVAIKVIDAPFRADSDYVARFEREAQAVAQLRHPHIVGIYRYGEAGGLLYIAMEYIDGADLAAILADYRARGRLISPAEAGRVIGQLCLALDYAHGQGVIHRDVKPSNVMIDRQGSVILTDFGLALLDHNTRGEIFGTPDYLAPEQAVSSARAVPQSDLYAVGVILYEMVAGRLPFEAATPLDLALRHLSEPPPPPRQINPAISPELEAVILQALAKEPAARYPTGAALTAALDQALQTGGSVGQAVSLSAEVGQTTDSFSYNAPAPPSFPPLPAAVETPAQPAELVTSRYILKNIGALLLDLMAGFGEDELRRFLFAVPGFKPAHYLQSGSKAEIVDRLLEFAEQTLQLEKLLALAQAHDPASYEKYRPYSEQVSLSRVDLVGRRLGKYHIVERLGQGGMAEVYKAYQYGLARYVAVKVIRGYLADQEEFVERFEQEAMAVAGLRHNHIVQVFDFDREGDLYYMVMEYIDGPTLESELHRRKAGGRAPLFSLTEVAALIGALADALDYAHGREMIHRDLKPGNVMLAVEPACPPGLQGGLPTGGGTAPEDYRVILTDFGVARILSVPSYTVSGSIVGTPAYMSPEQAQGLPVDRRSDVYSLGVILYELVTGRVPFEADTPLAIILKLASGEPLPPPTRLNSQLPRSVEGVILQALARQPADRYPTAGELARAFQAAVAGATAPGQPERSLAPAAGRPLEPAQPQPAPPEIHLPPAAPPAAPPPPARVLTISSNSGQAVLSDGPVFQFGTISGGQVTIGAPATSPPAGAPPSSDPRRALAACQARVAAEAPPDKKALALAHLDELAEILASGPPDPAVITYVQRWFSRNLPELAEAVGEVVRRMKDEG